MIYIYPYKPKTRSDISSVSQSSSRLDAHLYHANEVTTGSLQLYCQWCNITRQHDVLIMRSIVTGNDGSHDRSYTIVGRSLDRTTNRATMSCDQSENGRTCVTAVADRRGNRQNWSCVRRF